MASIRCWPRLMPSSGLMSRHFAAPRLATTPRRASALSSPTAAVCQFDARWRQDGYHGRREYRAGFLAIALADFDATRVSDDAL